MEIPRADCRGERAIWIQKTVWIMASLQYVDWRLARDWKQICLITGVLKPSSWKHICLGQILTLQLGTQVSHFLFLLGAFFGVWRGASEAGNVKITRPSVAFWRINNVLGLCPNVTQMYSDSIQGGSWTCLCQITLMVKQDRSGLFPVMTDMFCSIEKTKTK